MVNFALHRNFRLPLKRNIQDRIPLRGVQFFQPGSFRLARFDHRQPQRRRDRRNVAGQPATAVRPEIPVLRRGRAAVFAIHYSTTRQFRATGSPNPAGGTRGRGYPSFRGSKSGLGFGLTAPTAFRQRSSARPNSAASSARCSIRLLLSPMFLRQIVKLAAAVVVELDELPIAAPHRASGPPELVGIVRIVPEKIAPWAVLRRAAPARG